MREHRTGNHSVLSFQATNQQGNLINAKTQPMHTRIQFYMNRKVGDSFFLGCFNQSIEQVEIINFRLQFIVEHSLECCELRVHYDDRRSNTCFTKFRTFIGYGYSQIIDMVFL